MRRIARLSTFAAVALVAAVLMPGAGRVAPATAAAIAYPDLQVQVPTAEIAVGHPTPATRELRYTHIITNLGAGPLEMRPDYDPSTGVAHVWQALFSASGSGWTFATTVPIVPPMTYDAPLAKYRFPLGGFGLYSVGPSGSVGGLVAVSPKDEYCMTEDVFVGGVPNTPAQPNYPPSNCSTPTSTLGIDVGWGDRYDEEDPGQAIDLTNVPDGTYWLRAMADPYHYLAESSTANNLVDTQIGIAGDRVTVLQQTHPDSTPPAVSITSPAQGAAVSGTVTLTAGVGGPAAIGSVQFILDGQPLGPALSSAPYTFAWNTSGTPRGQHLVSAQAVDARGFFGTAPGVTISIAQRVGTFTVDVTLHQSGTGAATTPAFSTATGELLLALVGSDGPMGGSQTVSVSGGGLGWSLVQRSNGQAGDAEIWVATATSALTGATVTTTASQPGYDLSLTVLGVQGASGVGAHAAAGAPSGAPSIRLTTTAAGSWALAAGNDWDAAVPRTLASGQILLSQQVDTRVGDTFWVQATADTAGSTGQGVTLADTAPTADRWNLAALELLPGGQPPPPPPPDTLPPVVGIANPTAGQTVSGTTTVAANASDNVGVTAVQLLLDGQPLGPPLTAAPYGFAWDTTKVANGTHQLGATAADAAGNVGTAGAVAVTVANPPPLMTCFTIDARTSVDGRGTVTTAAFHTAVPGELLLAFAASDGPTGRSQSLTVTGAGLTWTLVRRANAQLGTAEIWRATAPTVLTSARLTSTQASGGFDQSLTVIAIQGADGIGASVAGGAASGAPRVTLTTTKAGSLVFGVGNDWDAAAARTVGANQVLLHQWVDAAVGDTLWSQYTTAAAGPAGSAVTIDDVAPTGDRWNLAAVEVLSDDA